MWKLVTITLASAVGLQQITAWVWDPLAGKALLDMPLASVTLTSTTDTGVSEGSAIYTMLDEFIRIPPLPKPGIMWGDTGDTG